jgi:hypothetical protein
MKNLVLLAAAIGTSAPAFGQGGAPSEQNLHTRTSFDLVVRAPYAEAARLFGPEGERAWAGEHWNPQFIHPQPGCDEQGAVFTVDYGAFSAVWVITQFDLEKRHFQYAYFVPDTMVTTIDVRFTGVDADHTQVNVVYTRTALKPEANTQVTAMTEVDQRAGEEWQNAIDIYLAERKGGHLY